MIIILLLLSITVFLIVGTLWFLGSRMFIIQKRVKEAEDKVSRATQKEYIQNLELINLVSKIETSASADPLTGLPTRKMFENRLQHILSQASSKTEFAILFLDLDGLKKINTVLGLKVGDELLEDIAKRIVSNIRKTDIVSRFAGDEFVLLLWMQPGKSDRVVYVAQRLLNTIAEIFVIEGHELFVTACIGIALYPIDGTSIDALLKNADKALQKAKAQGMNIFQFYHEDKQDRHYRELMLGTHLRNVTVYQNFLIYYQMIVDDKDKRIIGAEAMLYWRHPDFGVLAQTDFIHLAEQSGNIIGIGDWWLRAACKQFSEWKQKENSLQWLALKMSVKQLENPHLTYKVSQILQEFKMKPEQLMLEISGEILQSRFNLVEKSLRMLKQIGVKIGLSDFGDDTVSLNDLSNYAIDYLKISEKLIHELANSQEIEAIVEMIIHLAHSLKVEVIAEGVTDQKQKEKLASLGCTLLEGPLLSQPILGVTLSALLERSTIESA